MLRMTRLSHQGSIALRLEGKLLAPWVDEVRGATLNPSDGRVQRLDLSELSFVDEAGARLLALMRREGVVLEGISPLVAGLIDLHDR